MIIMVRNVGDVVNRITSTDTTCQESYSNAHGMITYNVWNEGDRLYCVVRDRSKQFEKDMSLKACTTKERLVQQPPRGDLELYLSERDQKSGKDSYRVLKSAENVRLTDDVLGIMIHHLYRQEHGHVRTPRDEFYRAFENR